MGLDDLEELLLQRDDEVGYVSLIVSGRQTERVEGEDRNQRVLDRVQALFDEGVDRVVVKLMAPKGEYLTAKTMRPADASPGRIAALMAPPAGPDSYATDQAIGLVRDHQDNIAAGYKQLRIDMQAGYGDVISRFRDLTDQLMTNNREQAADHRAAQEENRAWIEVALQSRVDAIEARAEAAQAHETGGAFEQAVDRGLGLIEKAVTSDVPEQLLEIASDPRVKKILTHPKLKELLADENMLEMLNTHLGEAP